MDILPQHSEGKHSISFVAKAVGEGHGSIKGCSLTRHSVANEEFAAELRDALPHDRRRLRRPSTRQQAQAGEVQQRQQRV